MGFKDVKESAAPRKPAQLYTQLCKALIKCGYKAQLDLSRTHTAFHAILKRSVPNPIQGITYPADFKFYREMHEEEIEAFQVSVCDALSKDEELLEFAQPLVFPAPNSKASNPLMDYILQRAATKSAYGSQFKNVTYDLGISIHPELTGANSEPSAFVPAEEWFAESLRELTLEEILPIFPKAERECFLYWLGRVVCGRKGNIQTHDGKPFNHTARIAIAIAGFPGCGKSTLMDALTYAITSTGYKVATFGNLASRFNLGSIASSHLAYCDDLNDEQFRATLSAPVFKSFVTNATVRCEDKGANAVDVDSNCAIAFNCNHIAKSFLSYGIDSGASDRLRVISTYSAHELPKGFTAAEHFLNLSKKHNCDIRAVFLWLCRQAADYFETMIASDPSRELIKEIQEISKGLRVYVDRNHSASFFLLMMTVAKSCGLKHLPEISAPLLNEIFTLTRHFAIDPSCNEARNELKQNWIDEGKPTLHPWLGMRSFSLVSIDSAYYNMMEQIAESPRDLDLIVERLFGSLRTRGGLRIGSKLPYIIELFDESRLGLPSLPTLKSMPCANSDKLRTNSTHLYDVNFNPKNL